MLSFCIGMATSSSKKVSLAIFVIQHKIHGENLKTWRKKYMWFFCCWEKSDRAPLYTDTKKSRRCPWCCTAPSWERVGSFPSRCKHASSAWSCPTNDCPPLRAFPGPSSGLGGAGPSSPMIRVHGMQIMRRISITFCIPSLYRDVSHDWKGTCEIHY